MKHEFKVTKSKDQTVYTLESASSGGTSSGSVASVSTALGGVQRRTSDTIFAQEEKTEAPKPRNFVAKNAKMGGAGKMKDKAKVIPRKEKHKKPLAESYAEDLAKQVFNANPNIKDENAVLDAAWPLVVKDLGNKRAMSMFNYDEDFPSDLVSVYGWLQKDQQGVAEGFRLRGTGNPGMPTPYDQGRADAKKGRPYDNPYDQPGEEQEHRNYRKGYEQGKQQGVAEGSLNEFAPDGFNGGDDDEGFSPEIAKMAQDDGFTKGAGLADGATLERAMAINHWHSTHGGMYKQYFAKGFKAGRMDKIRHNNKQYNLNLKLMKDGSIRHGEQGVAEGAPELLKKEMPTHRHAEKLLAQNGVSKDDPDYHHHLNNTIKYLRQFGNIDLINKSDEQGVAEDHEIQMASSELQSIAKNAVHLLDLVRKYSEQEGLDAWQQSKITKAADYLNAVLQSVSGEQTPLEGVGMPFRGVGGAFNRGDDERHDLDTPNNYAVAIDGKTWKVFADQKQAQNIARSLQSKGKNAKVHLTGASPTESVEEEWSQKYKSSINCSHPKGFSQKAHCAGKKKHNESMEMESVCPDCGMCETHGDNMMEVKQRLDAKCWKGKHKEGTKIKGGIRVNNCVPNESVAEDDYMMELAAKLAEKIPPNADVDYYIKDFAKSTAPQFKGKNPAKRKQMAIAAYYGSKQKKK